MGSLDSFSRVPQDADTRLLAGLRGLLEAAGSSTPSPAARAAEAVLARWDSGPDKDTHHQHR